MTAQGQHIVQIWFAHVDRRSTQMLATLLDNVERVRLVALRRDADQARFVHGAGLLRLLAAEERGCPPSAISVFRACERCGASHGRPRVPGFGSVSVAHAAGVVLVARSRTASVGVDVESVDALRGVEISRLRRRVCAPEEAAAVSDGQSLLRIWTAKEAVAKALGVGLRQPFEAFTVLPRTLPRIAGPAHELVYISRPRSAVVVEVNVDPGYIVALALLTPGRQLRVDLVDATLALRAGAKATAEGRTGNVGVDTTDTFRRWSETFSSIWLPTPQPARRRRGTALLAR